MIHMVSVTLNIFYKNGTSTDSDTVWQIAQRDYKMGKSKHISMTKVTYDLVANKFRSLWGQEAGWAQSVLFTANLKAFSDRLIAKTEIKEETEVKKEGDGIKVEEDENAAIETIVETKTVLVKGIKREPDEEERKLVETKHNVIRKTKRTRKA